MTKSTSPSDDAMIWLSSDEDDDFVPSKHYSFSLASTPISTSKRKAGRPPKRRLETASEDYELVIGSVQTHPLASKKQQVELMQRLIERQPTIAIKDIQPRNKTAYNAAKRKAAKDADTDPAQYIGTSYNAFRMMALSASQVQHLKAKLDSIAWDVRPDGCHVSRRVKKQRATVADQTARGTQIKCLQLDATYKGVFVDASFECVHIVLYAAGRYPPTSEHEVSHLCHNPVCVNLEHLCWEFHPDNHARERCRWTRGLKCPCGCNHSFTLCPHTPQCVPCVCTEGEEQKDDE